ncbi:PucR family transcriptional regulator [Nocardioides daejeonensis]|uniref:PucR family transcriptional regulator n=1 Tax=Nocardioides daejeonensis TaxID=1046556 RepID=UPI000D7435ED|nr:helix-turn-helix domain-containing protein [Nocardioides daejeonensis]
MTTPYPDPKLTLWLTTFIQSEQDPEHVDQWGVRTASAIRAAVPKIAEHPVLDAALDGAVREHWLAFLQQLAHPELQFRLVPAGEVLAKQVAAHQLPLESLVKIYRAAQQESWTYVTGVVSAIPDPELDHAEVLIYFWSRAAGWIDASIDTSIEIYQTERARIMAGVSAQRYEVVTRLLAGEEADPRQTSAELGGYPISVHHTGLVLVADSTEGVGELERIAHEAAKLLGAARPLVVTPGGLQTWAWLATRTRPDLGALEHLSSHLNQISARVYAGQPAEHVEGFVSSHQDAKRAAAVADRGGPWADVMLYEDVELVALLGCSDQVDRFVRRTLGGLVATDEGTQRVRETVTAFLQLGGNVEEVARELTVHRNTIRYRLGRAEELIGRPVNRFGSELLVALRHLSSFHGQDDF